MVDSCICRSHTFILALILHAQHTSSSQDEANLVIHAFSRYDEWKRLAARRRRSLQTVVIECGVGEMLIKHMSEFMDSGKWYNER